MIENGATVTIINRLGRTSVCAGRNGIVVDSDKENNIYQVQFTDDGTKFWFDSVNVVQTEADIAQDDPKQQSQCPIL
jgi:uncharacterized protein YkuJ